MILLVISLLMPAYTSESAWTEVPWNDNSSITKGQDSILPNLLPFDISGEEPQAFYLGSEEVPYSEYTSHARSSELWVRDNAIVKTGNNTSSNAIWKQYIQIHQGDRVDLVAYMPREGHADIYRISYSKGITSHKGYDLFSGYYNMMIDVDEIGRIFLLLVSDNHPSAVMLDVLPAVEKPSSVPVDVRASLPGKAKITVESEKVKGYDVYVDGAFYSSDMADDTMDGISTFYLEGDRMYTITISKRDITGAVYKNDYRRSFKGGNAYILRI